jgi:hypothetical protein
VLAPRQRALSRECSCFAWTMRKPAARRLAPDAPVRSSIPRPATRSSPRANAAAPSSMLAGPAVSHSLSARKRSQTCARTISSCSRATATRPADEALVRRRHAAARRLQARQGGRRAPPRRRAGTAHELPGLWRSRPALQLLRASFRVVTSRPRVVPGMSNDGRAVAPPSPILTCVSGRGPALRHMPTPPPPATHPASCRALKQTATAFHERLYDQIAAGDPELAAVIARRHVEDFRAAGGALGPHLRSRRQRADRRGWPRCPTLPDAHRTRRAGPDRGPDRRTC